MQQYLHDALRNNLRPVIKYCTRPQQKAVSEVVRGLFTEATPVLRHVAQDKTKTVKKQAEKYSYHLGNIDVTDEVDALALRKVKSQVRKHTVIAYDLCDINKEFSKKIEKMTNVFDGSRRKIAPGFFLHGVGINGILLKFQVHDNEVHTLSQIRSKIVGNISKELKNKGIWVFDRGNDSKTWYRELCQVHEADFIARVKENRYVVLKETGDYLLVKDLEPGMYEVHFMNYHNNKVHTDITYTLIINEHLEDKEPIRLISNLGIDQFTSEEFVTMYLERWGIENVFKRAKQKFCLEKIRVLSFRKFKNLVSLIQLATIIATVTFVAIQKSTHAVIVAVVKLYKNFLWHRSLEQNLDSFIAFMQASLPRLVHRIKLPSDQMSLFSRKCLNRVG